MEDLGIIRILSQIDFSKAEKALDDFLRKNRCVFRRDPDTESGNMRTVIPETSGQQSGIMRTLIPG